MTVAAGHGNRSCGGYSARSATPSEGLSMEPRLPCHARTVLPRMQEPSGPWLEPLHEMRDDRRRTGYQQPVQPEQHPGEEGPRAQAGAVREPRRPLHAVRAQGLPAGHYLRHPLFPRRGPPRRHRVRHRNGQDHSLARRLPAARKGHRQEDRLRRPHDHPDRRRDEGAPRHLEDQERVRDSANGQEQVLPPVQGDVRFRADTLERPLHDVRGPQEQEHQGPSGRLQVLRPSEDGDRQHREVLQGEHPVVRRPGQVLREAGGLPL